MIYFIQGQTSKAVKIGYTGNDPEKRLASLQTGSSEPLVMLGSVSGGIDAEKRLHAQFSAFRMHGEWFRPDEDLLAAVGAILSPPRPGIRVPYRIEDVRIAFGGESACCPCCGSDYQHPGTRSGEPGEVTVPFAGECGSVWFLELHFHKGITYAGIEVRKDCRNVPTADEQNRGALTIARTLGVGEIA